MFENSNYELWQGDCLELMKDIPDKSVNCIITDLPYGQTQRNKWDTVIPFEPLWEQYKRIVKDNAAIILFGSGMFTAELMESNKPMWKYNLIWEKTQPTGFLNAKKMPLKIHENILVFYKKLPTYNPQKTKGKPYKAKSGNRTTTNYGTFNDDFHTENTTGDRYPVDIIKFSREQGLHSTQKPVPLLEYLIKTYTNEGDLVLDNCMGSGSTGVACINTNRNFIGMELNEEFFTISKQRIDERLKEKEIDNN